MTNQSIADKNKLPTVSIIIPVYNAEKYIARCLESIEKQKFSDYEVLLVDDGSQDKSGEICKCFSERDARFKVISQKNSGVSVARNTGLKNAKGKYIQFVDSDDYVTDLFLEKMVGCMEETNADMVVCNYFQKDEKSGKKDMSHFVLAPKEHTKLSYIKAVSKCPGAHYVGVVWNKIYRRDKMQHKVFFEEGFSYGEDFMVNMKYLGECERIICIREQLYIYSWQMESSLTHQEKPEEMRISEKQRLYDAYCELFEKENLHKKYRKWMIYYMILIYMFEMQRMGAERGKYKAFLYQKCIADNHISRLEFVRGVVYKLFDYVVSRFCT